MYREIKIILGHTSWCPHCRDFFPIFELAEKKINPNNKLDGCKINFVSFEMDKDNNESKFRQEYPELIDYLKAYPTVYFQLIDNNTNKKKTEIINHTVAKQTGEIGKKKAAEEFINNIVNTYKTIMSGGKEQHMSVQKGGMLNNITSVEEVKYRNKYLKYKSKYLELKNN
jgi:thiol-disulfide isomerase/thioredoxin